MDILSPAFRRGAAALMDLGGLLSWYGRRDPAAASERAFADAWNSVSEAFGTAVGAEERRVPDRSVTPSARPSSDRPRTIQTNLGGRIVTRRPRSKVQHAPSSPRDYTPEHDSLMDRYAAFERSSLVTLSEPEKAALLRGMLIHTITERPLDDHYATIMEDYAKALAAWAAAVDKERDLYRLYRLYGSALASGSALALKAWTPAEGQPRKRTVRPKKQPTLPKRESPT